jgi:hypothetical protein
LRFGNPAIGDNSKNNANINEKKTDSDRRNLHLTKNTCLLHFTMRGKKVIQEKFYTIEKFKKKFRFFQIFLIKNVIY